MANLPELSQFDSVYQIETTDPVIGGPDGVSNAQAKALTNRTKYLKDLAEALGSGKQPLDETLTALAAIVTAADKLIYATGSDQFATSTLTAFARTLLDDADAATARGTLGVDTAIAAAVAALVNSSPSTLDTLNELAAALGNDPNFATTVTNAIAAKAGLASPTFTGNPAGPTPSQFDNDTSLATTAFVQRAIGNNAGVDSVNSATSLSAAHAGRLIVASGAGGFTITLPSAGAVITGCAVQFFNGAGSDVTIARNSSDLIWVNTNGYNLENIKIGSGDTLRLVSNGSNGWMVAGGTGGLKTTASFSASLAASGYQKLPSGLIIQWAINIATSANPIFSFPVAFPNACLSVAVSGNGNTSSYLSCMITNSSATQYNLYTPGVNQSTRIIAIGY